MTEHRTSESEPLPSLPRRRSRTDLTAARLRKLLRYEPETGRFFWRRTRGSMLPGMEAGTTVNGYRTIGIDNLDYRAHRLAWLYVYGRYPVGEIDHINRNPGDNRIANLQEGSHQENCFNRTWHTIRPHPRGVRHRGSTWQASIGIGRKACFLGTYDTEAEAVAAYRAGLMSLQYYLAYLRRKARRAGPAVEAGVLPPPATQTSS